MCVHEHFETKFGGGDRTRTRYPLLAKQMLSQLSYTPINLVDEVGLEPTMPEAEDLQSPGVTNFPTHPNFGGA